MSAAAAAQRPRGSAALQHGLPERPHAANARGWTGGASLFISTAMGVDVRRVARRLWQVPGKLMLATIVLCLGLREWYPFSPFPMYANFGPTAWYICVTDAAGQPLPAGRYFGLDATIFRRIFETRVLARVAAGEPRDMAEKGAAADTLEFLVREAHPEPGAPSLPEHIGLQRVVATLDADRVFHTHEMLAVRGGE